MRKAVTCSLSTLFAANGSVLLSRGVRLTNGYIRSLAQKGVQYIYLN
ncbi:hypothetical protein B4114_2670 [Geobacillus stearothermophilus]|uniref:Uncharacterized protein n=2 Tax=Anoxybacillaceae TaxID=3120669 RepID=A0A150NAR2_GEOSE|nr:hypothetical protein B4114_2670 [Geobacillus stearothermophilus]